MSTPRPLGALLRAAHEHGVELRITRGEARIVVRGPVEPALLVELRQRREEIAAELVAHGRPSVDPVAPLLAEARLLAIAEMDGAA